MTLREVGLTIGAMILSVGVSWGIATEKIAGLESDIVELKSRIYEVELRQDKKDDQVTEMKTTLAKISVDISWIKEALINREK